MPRDRAGVDIERPSRAKGRDKPNRLAFVKIMGRGLPWIGDRESAEQDQPRVRIFYRHRSLLGEPNRPFRLRSWDGATLIDRYGGVKKKVRLGTEVLAKENFFLLSLQLLSEAEVVYPRRCKTISAERSVKRLERLERSVAMERLERATALM
jgi:hypothetical protein